MASLLLNILQSPGALHPHLISSFYIHFTSQVSELDPSLSLSEDLLTLLDPNHARPTFISTIITMLGMTSKDRLFFATVAPFPFFVSVFVSGSSTNPGILVLA